jgi:hypothetical protein
MLRFEDTELVCFEKNPILTVGTVVENGTLEDDQKA